MTILWNNSRGEFEEIIQQYSLCLWWILGKRTWLWYISSVSPSSIRSDEGLKLETSALKFFTMVNLCY